MTLQELVAEFMGSHAPGWLTLDDDTAGQLAVDATRYYAAFGDLKSYSAANQPSEEGADPQVVVPSPDEISLATEVTNAEWAVIRPLFWLYCERKNAQLLEATRAGGVEVFGRSVSEIQPDITMMEQETLPARAFRCTVIEVS